MRFATGLGVLALALLCSPVGAQQNEPAEMSPDEAAIMQAWEEAMTPGPQHAEMAALEGTWAMTTTWWMYPDSPPQVAQGTAVRTMIMEGRVLQERVTSPGMFGQPFEGLALTGYDNVTGAYWGTWTDNMSTGVTLTTGRWDDAAGMFVFEGETPDPMTGGTMPMRIESRTDGDDREVSEFFFPGPDGQMFKSMEIVYERQ